MRSTFSSLMAVAATLPAVLAHYNFEALIVNGNITDAYEYVRQTTNSNSPIVDVTSDNFICNQGGLDSAIRAKTKTHTVSPGDEVGFTVNVEIGHPGPLAVYMSKAPDGTATSDYLGDGDWFKVYELTTSSITDAGLQWATYINNAGIHNFTFALPDTLPAGNYLMRAEHIGLHGASTKGGAQFYIGCAQLAVEGSGSGTPSPTVKFPGAYTGEEPGVLINIYYPAPQNYTAPGPKTWPKACEDHTANLAGQTSDGDCTGSTEDSGSDSGSSSSSAAASAGTPTATAIVVSSPASTPAASPTIITSVITPAAEATTPVVEATTTAAAAEATSVSSAAPAATTTKAAGSSCSAKKRSFHKAKRSAKRTSRYAQKRSIEDLMREGRVI